MSFGKFYNLAKMFKIIYSPLQTEEYLVKVLTISGLEA